jgi:hypothetical protein
MKPTNDSIKLQFDKSSGYEAKPAGHRKRRRESRAVVENKFCKLLVRKTMSSLYCKTTFRESQSSMHCFFLLMFGHASGLRPLISTEILSKEKAAAGTERAVCDSPAF